MKAKRTCAKCGRDLMNYELSCLQCSSSFLDRLLRRHLPAGEVVPVRGADFVEMLVRIRDLEAAASPADQEKSDD